MSWRTDRCREEWRVVFDDGKNPREWWLGRDGSPLSFWNQKSAQLKADALNRKGEHP